MFFICMHNNQLIIIGWVSLLFIAQYKTCTKYNLCRVCVWATNIIELLFLLNLWNGNNDYRKSSINPNFDYHHTRHVNFIECHLTFFHSYMLDIYQNACVYTCMKNVMRKLYYPVKIIAFNSKKTTKSPHPPTQHNHTLLH